MLPNWVWCIVEKRYVFFPTSEIEMTPADVGLEFQDLFFPSANGNLLHGWFVPGSGNGIWLWFHGNGGNIGHRVIELALLHQRLAVSVLIFDYQGYGRSQGKPSELGTYQDARAALNRLRQFKGEDSGPVVYYGHSLGTAIAVKLAVEHTPTGLVLVSPFTSISDMAGRAFPWLPVSSLVKGHYDTLSLIPKVGSPVLVLHGEDDELVPFSHGVRLFRAAQEPKAFQALTQTGHNDTFQAGGEVYWVAIKGFLDRL